MLYIILAFFRSFVALKKFYNIFFKILTGSELKKAFGSFDLILNI